MGLPDFICIGTQKAGTSWLYRMLVQNPELWLPPLKELHFFDRKDGKAGSRQVVSQQVKKLHRKHKKSGVEETDETRAYLAYLDSIGAEDMLSEAWYRRIFDHPMARAKVSGEITPAYLDLKPKKLKYAMTLIPETKFIAIIREPLARALSQLRMEIEAKKLEPETEAEWQSCVDNLKKVKRGDYKKAIPAWNKKAGENRILYLPFSDVRDRPRELLAKIEDFLGVSHFDGYQEFDEQVHKTKKIVVPDWVVKQIETDIMPQRAFLIKKFGEEFYEKTK